MTKKKPPGERRSAQGPDPAAAKKRITAFVRDRLADPGWAFIFVMDDPPFGYTVGLTANFEHPEIVVYGFDQEQTAHTLNLLGQRVKAGERFVSGQRVAKVLADYDVLLQEVPPSRRHGVCNVAAELYRGEAFAVLQMLWPDEAGKFPGEPGYDAKWYRLQPVLCADPIPRN